MTASSPRRCVITGASRGLGFEFARQLATAGEFVVATCRTPASAAGLRELLAGGELILPLEVSDQLAATAAATAVAERADAVDLRINAAGIEDSARSSGPVGRLDGDALVEVYRTNAVGPALVTQAFAGLLACAGRLTLTDTGAVLDHDDVLAAGTREGQ